MTSYILRRLLLLLPTLLGITIVTFAVMALSPGGVRSAVNAQEGALDPRARVAMRLFLEHKYGLDKPLPIQYLIWLNKVSPIGKKDPNVGWPQNFPIGFKPCDLGDSIVARRPVLDMIEESLPTTLLLFAIMLPLTFAISIWSGIAAANRRGGIADVGGGTIMLGLWSIPQIWAGVLLIGFLANKQFLHWFPAGGLHDIRADEFNFLPSTGEGGFHRGWLLDSAWHLVLPIICLSYAYFAFTAKLTRGAMLENISADFVRTARAKGLSRRVVLYRHILRNALLPLITHFAMIAPTILSGALIVETIFDIPGMGRLGVDAVFDKDPEMVLSITLVASILGLISFLIGDIAYAIADPRVSFEDAQ
jgi:ABC-type dipeptide/oligopeptide/nickel transport system permease component